MSNIERAAGRSLALFTFDHPERYSSLESYRSTKADYQVLVEALLADGWTLEDGAGVWCIVRPPLDQTPESGFKIHVSATDDTARTLLSRMVPMLVSEGVAFKFLADRCMLELHNSSAVDRASSGKFLVVYPAGVDQFRSLMERLHEATKDLAGPYILSDKRYDASKVLFFRYGAFKGRTRVNTYGEMDLSCRLPDGRPFQDQRLPYFHLPEGIDDPYPSATADAAEPVLHDRYRATAALGMSSKGGVYLCTDLATGTEVVIKEARPFVNRGRSSAHDAVDCLKNEHEILELLEGTGVTPRALDFFQEWENSFLVLERAPGIPLSSFLVSEGFSILLMTGIEAADVHRYCTKVLRIAEALVAGVRAIHARGVVIQDLAPQNILLDPDRLTITFVDFEAAYADRRCGESPIIHAYTPGYGEAQRQAPTMAADYRALSCVLTDLIYPVSRFFSLAPERREPMLERVTSEHGIPDAFVRLIVDAGECPEDLDARLEEAQRSLASIRAPKPAAPALRQKDDLRSIVVDIASYILAEIRSGDDPLDLPTDYRRFTTNRLSVAYGASGIACFLKRVTGEVPLRLLDAISAEVRSIDDNPYPPGLYVGTSGIAWTLLELGMRREAESLMQIAARSPIRFESTDLFYGAAGHGLANLFFFERLGDEQYLANAIDTFGDIKTKLQRTDAGYCYVNEGDVHHGIAHGAAGIGYFMLRLYRATRQEEHLAYAKGLLDFELASAEERQGQMMFRRSAGEPVLYVYWRGGSAGIGSVALRFYEELGEERYMQAARRVARHLRSKYSISPTNFCGMAGIGHFFLDMHKVTADEGDLEEARRFVDRIMLFAIERPSGIVFPGEEVLRISTDYGTGSAGIGIFIHRTITRDGVPFFDF